MKYNNELKNIDTEEKAYLLGFFYGDGTISTYLEKNRRRYQAKISISIIDKELILKLKEIFPYFYGYEFDYSKYNKNSKKQISITNRSKAIYDDLLAWGVYPRKSYENKETLSIPPLNNNLIPHFIRGFFDADGSVYIQKNRRNLIRIEIICNSLKFINEINSILIKNNINCWSIRDKKPTGKGKQNYYIIQINKQEEVHKFGNYIYQNATVYLNRKYEKITSHKIVNKVLDRKYECANCGSYHVIKNGTRNNKIRLKCKNCNSHFTVEKM